MRAPMPKLTLPLLAALSAMPALTQQQPEQPAGFKAASQPRSAADATTGFTTLYICSIEAGECASPSGLILDGAGNLYGTAGNVFKLDTTDSLTIIYKFGTNPMDGIGAASNVPLVRDGEGNLYGTTSGGGANDEGSVFRIDAAGNETVLYSFGSLPLQADGWSPMAGLVLDSAGNVYGTTNQGGSHGFGIVFKVDGAGNETVLYNFDSTGSGLDGYSPLAGLIQDSAGNFYGTTTQGGASETVSGGTASDGVAFKLDPAGNETVLYSFCTQPNCADGTDPVAGLIQDGAGNLYGTTSQGGTGAYVVSGDPQLIGGTVFRIDPAGNETVLYSFCSQVNCADGAAPMAGLVMDSAGNLYGTTSYGGANSPIGIPALFGAGTVFRIDSAGNETVLHNFCSQSDPPVNCVDRYGPVTGLTLDANGNLFGTTPAGGGGLAGTIFELAGAATIQIVQTPQFSPAAGTYTTAQTVRLTDGTPDAIIYYTTDGTSPTTNSSVYGESIPVSDTTTIKAIATKSGYTPSAVATATYTIQSLIPTQLTLTGDPNPGTPGGAVTFTVRVKPTSGSGTPAGTISTTIDGAAGPSLTLNSGSATFSSSSLTAGSHTIVATYGGDSSYSGSSATLIETITSANPAASIAVVSGSGQTTPYGSAFANPLVVIVKDANGDPVSGALVKFSGSGLSFSSATATTGSNGEASVTATAIASGSLTASASTSGVSGTASFTLTATKVALTVTATNAGVAYNQPIPALAYTVIPAFVNGDTSAVLSGSPAETTTATQGSAVGAYPISITRGTLSAADYTFSFVNGTLTITSLGTAATPAFSPAAGTYTSAQSVSIEVSTTTGAIVYYTTSGVAPTTSSTQYSTPQFLSPRPRR